MHKIGTEDQTPHKLNKHIIADLSQQAESSILILSFYLK